jgi:SAM-dependent methyltransferase
VSEDSLQSRSERISEDTFIGGPRFNFEQVGRLGFEVLLKEGLRPSSRVLDVGCGALRLGYWLMRFLDPGCYFGIEPQREMLQVGLDEMVEPEVVARAGARFDHNTDFDFSVFGESFDYAFARSVWTHASKPQIAAMLESFARTGAPGAVFMASFYPAGTWFRIGHRWPRLERDVFTRLPLVEMSPLIAGIKPFRSDDYEGEEWLGRSHESSVRGVANHSTRWIAGEAARHGLTAQLTPYRIRNHQYWIRIRHP